MAASAMDSAKVLLKELKEVAKDVGVLEKSTKLKCAPRGGRSRAAACTLVRVHASRPQPQRRWHCPSAVRRRARLLRRR